MYKRQETPRAQDKPDAFFRRVRGILSAGTALRVVQFVDMEDVSARTDSFCRSLCYLLGLGKQIRYEFYEFRASRTGYVYLIRDALMLQYLREPFSREVYLLETADPALVGRYCAAADAYIRGRLPLAQAPNLQQLRRQQQEQQQQQLLHQILPELRLRVQPVQVLTEL